MKMINPGSDAPPVEQPYDLLDRVAVDKRKADFRYWHKKWGLCF